MTTVVKTCKETVALQLWDTAGQERYNQNQDAGIDDHALPLSCVGLPHSHQYT